jgi:hypothetical protein
MLVRIEVEFDDTTLSIEQRDVLSYSSSNVCSGAAVLAMGQCAGRMLAALGAESRESLDMMVEELHKTILRATQNPVSDPTHPDRS